MEEEGGGEVGRVKWDDRGWSICDKRVAERFFGLSDLLATSQLYEAFKGGPLEEKYRRTKTPRDV